jgi:hypothetical protein
MSEDGSRSGFRNIVLIVFKTTVKWRTRSIEIVSVINFLNNILIKLMFV